MALAAGDKLGPYEILSPIAAGGMGEVYRCRDTRLGREVAIKVLPARMLSDPYFQAAPPKSTGREIFHLRWLEQHLDGGDIAPADVQATLLELTVRTVADAIRTHAPGASEVLVCGGGVHNGALMNALAAALAPLPVRSTAVRGIDPDFVEAMLFAWLARERMLGRSAPGVSSVTGARGPRVLGGIYFGA